MTDPKLAEIMQSVRNAGFTIGKELNESKRLEFAVHVDGVGTFGFELSAEDAIAIAICLAKPFALYTGEEPE